ncbi:FHA domain-containing protein [Pontiellaceae bacterium B12227]|nr:FHA domain-containing protein [Pontiellaceae bacterium B12227]
MIKVTEIDGGGNSSELSEIRASGSITTVGRSHEADICFGEDDQSVSRKQFEISFSGDVPSLKNTGKNPVLCKGPKKQLAPNAKINIQSGLEIAFRDSKLRFDVVVPAVYCLKTKGGAGRAEFQIESGRKYTVGRSPECDITLESAGVSRRHCRIHIETEGMLSAHDLGSVNGVRLIEKGEVQEESTDIDVPYGTKFIIGDIECSLEKEGKGSSSGKKKLIMLPVVIVVLLGIVSASYFVLKPGADKPGGNGQSGGDKPKGSITSGTHTGTSQPDIQEPNDDPKPPVPPIPPGKNNIEKVQTIIQSEDSFDNKANQFAVLKKEPEFKELKPVCMQLEEYYSQCEVVKKLTASLSQEYELQIKKTRDSIQKMKFDFEISLPSEKLEAESRKLQSLHTSVSRELKKNDVALAPPRNLTNEVNLLLESAEEYEGKAQSLSFIWADLENSSFAADKFDKREVMASIETLYPDEGMGSEVCAKIDEIISYQRQMSLAYKGLVGQVRLVLSNYKEFGVSKEYVPKRWVLEDLRKKVESPLPEYFEEPPPVTDVSSSLNNLVDGISSNWANLEFLDYCGDWKKELEKKKNVFTEVDEVIQVVDELCEQASLKCVVDLGKELETYRAIKSRLESGEELGFNDARKLIQVYDRCHVYLQNDLFCTLQKQSKKEIEAVSKDCLDRLCKQLATECFNGTMATDASVQGDCLGNAEKILAILDSAVYLPPDVKTKIQGDRGWVKDTAAEIEYRSNK